MTGATPLLISLNPAKVAKLAECIGACVAQYPQIEAYLKLLLPLMHRPECEPSPTVDWKRLTDSKATLGQLFRELAKKYTTDVPDVRATTGIS